MDQLTVSTPAFSESLRALQTTDPAHPDTWNPNYQALLSNDHWLREKVLFAQDQLNQLLGSDEVSISDQVDALVQYGAQRIFTERREQVPEYVITSAVSGDDSIDLESTDGVEKGQHYFVNDSGNVQTVQVSEVLSGTRVTLTKPLTSTVAVGSVFSRLAPDNYVMEPISNTERGATVYAEGTDIDAFGLVGNEWESLYRLPSGGWEVVPGMTRLRFSGNVSRVATITALPIGVTRGSENISPADGASGLTTTPTLVGDSYYPLYGVPQAKRTFQISGPDGDFSAPLYEGEEIPAAETPVLQHTVTTALATDSGYMWRYRDETAEGEKTPWSIPTSFSTADIYVEAPTITSPADGATEVPEQPILETSAFSVFGGTDDHVSTSWRLKDAQGNIVWESLDDTQNLLSIILPQGIIQEGGLTYTVEARHQSLTYGVSQWSAAVTFTTATSFIPDEVGAAYGGGYVAGKIVSDYDGETYLLIVSDGGGDSVQTGAGTFNYMSSTADISTTDGVPPKTLADGRANHNAILAQNDLANFPAFKWIEDNLNSGEGLNGYTDWYLPSRDELELLYRNLKPTTDANNDGTRADNTSYYGADGAVHGTNANSDPAGAGYTTTDPAQTSLASFQAGGADAFEAHYYWSSTESYSSYAWSQTFSNGYQYYISKTLAYRVRAVRRIKL